MRFSSVMFKQLLAASAVFALAAPVAVQAQEVPSYASTQADDQQIRGRVVGFDGGYNLSVRDDNGYVDNVQLHDGTIINPTGITLAPGMVVSVVGYNAGQAFDANEIDTPYTFDDGVPYYAGQPWTYYGPSFDLGFFFGNIGWWHGGGGWGGYGRSYGYGRGYGYGYGYGHGAYGYGHGGFGNGYGHGYNTGVHVNNVTVNNGGYGNHFSGGGYHGGPNTGFANRGGYTGGNPGGGQPNTGFANRGGYSGGGARFGGAASGGHFGGGSSGAARFGGGGSSRGGGGGSRGGGGHR
jgi:hypothetical protein